ncbi:hypothetical protein ColLi_11907 [Colletotrichum liriopes]|uniref:Uncharacterized protein n=1 Tax=Colletotrichum liriopes TaxID=708192 RepID=A0AA37GXC7_9PEZI|nr:hypothetical protein ColLi_11907 [Colletotrichum liriopes]
MAASEKRSPSVERREHTINHVDSVLHDEKPVAQDEENRDWTGSAKKTDPEEIRLVRKLDWRIMVN